jgi:hypothetical protein
MIQTLGKNYREEHQWGIILAAGEGIRVRDFLSQLYGGRGIKQFSAVPSNQTMLDHTFYAWSSLFPPANRSDCQ